MENVDPPHAEILAVLGVGTWDWRIDADRVRHDPTWCAFLGVGPERLEHDFAFFRDLVHPEDTALVTARIERTLVEDGIYQSLHRLVRPDGKVLWVEDAGKVIERDAEGRAKRMIGAIRDVTDSVALERELDASRRSFQDVTRSLPGVVMSYTLHPDGTDAIAYASPESVEVWECTPEAIVEDSQVLWRQVDAEDVPALVASIHQAANTFERWSHRWRITTPSGRRKWLHGYGRPVPGADGTVRGHVFILDVTEQVAIEEALAASRDALFQTQKAEAIGRLSGGIAHDFNNLLFIILGNLELMSDSDDPAFRARCLDDALTATLRGRELTTSLLTSASRAPLRPRVLDLDAMVRATADSLKAMLPNDVSLRVSLSPDLVPVVADPAAAESAIANLVANARDAMPEGGRLTIETTNLHVDAAALDGRNDALPAGDYARIAVGDTGVGIAPQHLPQVFTPFFTTKPVGTGPGLGLSMALGFAKQSGGTVRLTSETGVGTTAELLLPRAQAVRVESPAPPPRTPQRKPARRILLVDDEAGVRTAVAALLRRDGFDVVEAADGLSAVALFEGAATFDLVLSDVVMPGPLHGPALIGRLRTAAPELPAILMSGYPPPVSLAEDDGRDALLLKPIRADELMRAVHRALR